MFSRLWFLAVLILFAVSGCTAAFPSAETPDKQGGAQTTVTEPAVSPADSSQEAPSGTGEETDTEPNENPADGIEEKPTDPDDNNVSLPHRGPDEWHYDLYAIFRGAEEILFDDAITYTRNYEHTIVYEEEGHPDWLHTYTCEITLPQSAGNQPWAEGINAYYQSLLPEYIAEGDDVWNENIDSWYVTGLTYYYEGAYQTQNVLTVMRSRFFEGWRPSVSWEPFAEIFSVSDGRRLELDDLFCVGREEYLPVLQKSLSNAVMCFREDYDPGREDQFKPWRDRIIRYFDSTSVAVTPFGLVFIYPIGTAASMATGPVFLNVPYDDIQNLLNPVYFPLFAGTASDEEKALYLYHSFLGGKTDAVRKDNGETFNINMILDGGGADSIYYATLDMNGDDIPELLIFSGNYFVFTYQDGGVVFLLDAGNDQHGSVVFLENGAIFCTHRSTGIFYRYITFDSQGNLSEVNFGSPPDGSVYPYSFNGKEVSENEWEDLTKEYFSLAEKATSVEWQPY